MNKNIYLYATLALFSIAALNAAKPAHSFCLKKQAEKQLKERCSEKCKKDGLAAQHVVKGDTDRCKGSYVCTCFSRPHVVEPVVDFIGGKEEVERMGLTDASIPWHHHGAYAPRNIYVPRVTAPRPTGLALAPSVAVHRSFGAPEDSFEFTKETV